LLSTSTLQAPRISTFWAFTLLADSSHSKPPDPVPKSGSSTRCRPNRVHVPPSPESLERRVNLE
jgi:hypothetical protein